MSGVSTVLSARGVFLARHLAPVLPAVGLLLRFDGSAFDRAITGWFFDPVARVFPLRYNGLVETVGHHFMNELVVVVCCCAIALYLLSFVLPELKPRRRLYLFLTLALTLAPLAVALLKATSARHCPWDLEQYGGFAPLVQLFDAAPQTFARGHCFPGGHASAGFALLAFYFAGHASGNRPLTLFGLWGGFSAGMAFGMIRVVQGAHFMSHNLWSAVICWLVMLSIYTVMGMQEFCVRERAPATKNRRNP